MKMEIEPGRPVLLDGAKKASARDWDVAAAAVLRKARKLAKDAPDDDAWDALARSTVEGLAIPPLGTPDRLAASGGAPFALEALTGSGSIVARAESGWDIRALVADPDPATANAAALADLENGATSLWLSVGGAGTPLSRLPRVLDGVLLELAAVVLQPAGEVTELQAAVAFTELIDERGGEPDAGTNLGADPIGRSLRSAGPAPDRSAMFAAVRRLGDLASGFGIRALMVDGTVAHDAGAGDAAELGYALAVGADYLRALEAGGCGIEDALGLLEFRFAATAEQFSTIAKFRAARGLWRRVAEISGAAGGLGDQLQHAVTSLPMLTRYDPWVNLLRTTVAAFAAGVGGADAVTVLPFDTRLGVPDALGRRMARNISALLISEALAAAVTDPAAGSSAVEILTRELAEAGWAEFQRIERAGGIRLDDSMRGRWAETATERVRRIATRKQPITGVSEFPNLREVLPTRRSALPFTDVISFWADSFEGLRDEPAVQPVFLATLGTVPEHAARAGFMANLFAAGGVDTVTAGATTGVEDVVAAFTAAGAPVACLAGTDAAYAEIGAAVIGGLRAAGASRVVSGGRPKGELAQLVDDHFAAGEDAVAFLQRTRQSLSMTEVTA
jgi:methylmalonyl-CoA mutase